MNNCESNIQMRSESEQERAYHDIHNTTIDASVLSLISHRCKIYLRRFLFACCTGCMNALWDMSIYLLDFDVSTVFARAGTRPSKWPADVRHKYARHLLRRLALPLWAFLTVSTIIVIGRYNTFIHHAMLLCFWYCIQSLLVVYVFAKTILKTDKPLYSLLMTHYSIVISIAVGMIEAGVLTISPYIAWASGNSLFAVYILIGLPCYLLYRWYTSDTEQFRPVRVLDSSHDGALHSIKPKSNSPILPTRTDNHNDRHHDMHVTKSPLLPTRTDNHTDSHHDMHFKKSSKERSLSTLTEEDFLSIHALPGYIAVGALCSGIAITWFAYTIDRAPRYWFFLVFWILPAAVAISILDERWSGKRTASMDITEKRFSEAESCTDFKKLPDLDISKSWANKTDETYLHSSVEASSRLDTDPTIKITRAVTLPTRAQESNKQNKSVANITSWRCSSETRKNKIIFLPLITLYCIVLMRAPDFLGHFATLTFSTIGLTDAKAAFASYEAVAASSTDIIQLPRNAALQGGHEHSILQSSTATDPIVPVYPQNSPTQLGDAFVLVLSSILVSCGYMACMQLLCRMTKSIFRIAAGSTKLPRFLFGSQAYFYFYWYLVTGSGTSPWWIFITQVLLMNLNYILSATHSYPEIYATIAATIDDTNARMSMRSRIAHSTTIQREERSSEDGANSGSSIYQSRMQWTFIVSCCHGCMTGILNKLHLYSILTYTTIIAFIRTIITILWSQNSKPFEYNNESSPMSNKSRSTSTTPNMKPFNRKASIQRIHSLMFFVQIAEQDTLADISSLLLIPAIITMLAILKDKTPRIGAPSGYAETDLMHLWARFIVMAIIRSVSARIMRQVFARKFGNNSIHLNEMISSEPTNNAHLQTKPMRSSYHIPPNASSLYEVTSVSFPRVSETNQVDIESAEFITSARSTHSLANSCPPSSPATYWSLKVTGEGGVDEYLPFFVITLVMVAFSCFQAQNVPVRFAFSTFGP